MYQRTKLRRTAALAMTLSLLLGSIPASAIEDGVKPVYDEAYYATTDYYGNLTEGSVVKSYRTNGIATVTDYGQYDEVINLTDGTAPTVSGNKTVFSLDESNVPKTFYFEGKTPQPFEALPWTLSVHYALNGVTMKAEELAGKTGMVEITVDAVPNLSANEYAKNNYTLEAMAIFNQDDILSLEAPGAQVQLIGNLRAVLFIGLPGEKCHFTIRVGSEDFSFGGMTFLMVPATLSQLEEIAKLSERKDDLEENYDKLSGSMDSLLDAMTAMTGSLNASANGLDRLNEARGIFSNGKGTIYAGTDTLRGDLSNLAKVLEPVEDQITALSKAISQSKSTLNSMVDTVGDLQDDLEDVEDALSALEGGTGDVKRVLTALGSLRKSLTALQTALGGQVSDTAEEIGSAIEGSQNIGSTTISQVKEAHSAYVADREDYYTVVLQKQGVDKTTAKTLAALAVSTMRSAGYDVETAKTALAAQLTSLQAQWSVEADTQKKAALEQQIQAVGAVQQYLSALETAYQAKAAMTFQDFCQKVLGQPAATAKQMNDLWLVYASGKVDGGGTPSDGGTLSDSLLHKDSEPENNGGGEDALSSGTDNEHNGDPAPAADSTLAPADESGENGTADSNEAEGETTREATEDPIAPSESIGGAVVDLIAGGLDSALSEIAKLQTSLTQAMNMLKDPTTQVVSDLALLCRRIEELSGLLNDAEDLSSAVRDASGDLRSILGDVKDLQDTLNDYEPVLQDTLSTVSALSTSAIKTIRDTEALVADTEALMKSTGSVLDDGTKQTLAGLSEVLRSTARTMNTAGEIRDAKSSICEIIEDTWDEYTGEVNNLLLMDATAEAVSLTDTRNAAPESIQVLIRTQEIKADSGKAEELAAQETVKTTFWQRLTQMFRDFWNAVTGIFKGKD